MGGGGDEKLSYANIFLKHICLRKHFFPRHLLANKFFSIFFSVLFLFVLNITIALLNYFSKNLISSAIASLYFVDIHSTQHFLISGSY